MHKDIWFYSDPHFGHKNILKYCPRPFQNLEEMERGLIEAYNAVVKPFDIVYFLGDVFFCGTIKAKEILKKLNGYKILIRGNHDFKPEKMREIGFDEVHEQLKVEIEGVKLKLCHFPYKPYTGDLHPSVLGKIAQIKGDAKATGNDSRRTLDDALDEMVSKGIMTVEQKERLISYDMRFWSRRYEDDGGWLLCGHVHDKWLKKKRMINVGVDKHDMAPVSFSKILELMQVKEDVA